METEEDIERDSDEDFSQRLWSHRDEVLCRLIANDGEQDSSDEEFPLSFEFDCRRVMNRNFVEPSSSDESGGSSDDEVCFPADLAIGSDGFAEVFAELERQQACPLRPGAELVGLKDVCGRHRSMQATQMNASQLEAVSQEVLEFKGCKTIQEDCFPGDLCKYEGILLHFDAVPRALPGRDPSDSPKRRCTGNCMVDMLLVDRTGPMRFALFGCEAVEAFLSQAKIETANRRIVALSVVRIGALPENSWNGNPVTRCWALATVATSGTALGTCVSFPEHASSPFLLTAAFAIPSARACISSYEPFASQMKSPFRSTVRGWVCDVQIQSCKYPVQDGPGPDPDTPQRRFKLLDGTGAYIQCCALHHNAQSPAISIGREIILYYGTGRGPTGNVPGMLYALKDSLILAVGIKIPLSLCVLGRRVDIE